MLDPKGRESRLLPQVAEDETMATMHGRVRMHVHKHPCARTHIAGPSMPAGSPPLSLCTWYFSSRSCFSMPLDLITVWLPFMSIYHSTLCFPLCNLLLQAFSRHLLYLILCTDANNNNYICTAAPTWEVIAYCGDRDCLSCLSGEHSCAARFLAVYSSVWH